MRNFITLRMNRLPAWVQILFAVTFSLLYVLYLFGGRHYDIRVPFATDGDGLFHLLLIKRLIGGDGYFLNTALGFPYGSTLYDFPGSDSLSIIFLYIVGKITSNHVVAFNAYYIIGFPLATLSFSVVARQMGISSIPSAIGGILFAFLPFHFLRINHLYFTWYFVVPLFIWYGWKVYDFGSLSDQKYTKQSWLFACIGLLLIACVGIYYTIFGIIVLIVSGVVGSVERRSIKNIFLAIAASTILMVSVLANTAPNLIYQFNHGKNTAVAQRVPQESELYGLKIAQLLLPWSGHRYPPLKAINKTYADTYPLVNENASASLGIVGGLGFLGLLATLAFEKRISNEPKPLRFMSVVLFVLLLTATIGGFSSIFALLVSPLVRAWNRISIFISFLSIAASMYALSWASDSLRRYRLGTGSAIAVAMLVLLVGLWDQVGERCDGGCVAQYRGSFAHEQAFFDKVQRALPKGAAIYTLPFMEFPETPPRNKLGTYALAAGYLHTNGLRWSYGAMKGRDRGDEIFRELEQKPAKEQLAVIRQLGFSGILIDRRGYPNEVADIEHDLVATGQVRLAAEQDFRAFYVLNP